MKTKYKFRLRIAILLAALFLVIYAKLQPLREYHGLGQYSGPIDVPVRHNAHDPRQKTVIIMADNRMTEFFDLMAPFDLFSRTGLANVYVVAQKNYPIAMENGPFILPHYTYSEIDSMAIHPDVIVIPYMHSPDSAFKTKWLKDHTSDSTILLSICDGAWTAAASGLYDGKPLTSHATGHAVLKEKYPQPAFLQDVTVTEQGNLFSTGGVSNATDGSLAVIEKVFGKAVMLRVLRDVHYPGTDINKRHKSVEVSAFTKLKALRKVLLGHNPSVGILLTNGISELEIAALFDTYSRSLPSSIKGLALFEKAITTRHGLTLIPDGSITDTQINELHIVASHYLTAEHARYLEKVDLFFYDSRSKIYMIDQCLNHIHRQYGAGFNLFVKRMLDYN